MHTIKTASTLRKAIENRHGYPREKGCKIAQPKNTLKVMAFGFAVQQNSE